VKNTGLTTNAKLYSLDRLTSLFTIFTVIEKVVFALPFLCSSRMWADAHRDGRPAECAWRSLVNAVDQIAKITKPGRETH